MESDDTAYAGRTRRRDAAATRKALLTAARVLIAQRGAEGTSTRDVAGAAGVNQALVYRYFGSKEKLFAEAVGGAADQTDNLITGTPLADLPRALLARALDVVAAVDADSGSISALITGANDETIRAVLRDRIAAAFATQLAARLDGPDAALRAELLAALVTGIGFLRGKVGTPALSAADAETLGAYVDRMVEPLLVAEPEPVD